MNEKTRESWAGMSRPGMWGQKEKHTGFHVSVRKRLLHGSRVKISCLDSLNIGKVFNCLNTSQSFGSFSNCPHAVWLLTMPISMVECKEHWLFDFGIRSQLYSQLFVNLGSSHPWPSVSPMGKEDIHLDYYQSLKGPSRSNILESNSISTLNNFPSHVTFLFI